MGRPPHAVRTRLMVVVLATTTLALLVAAVALLITDLRADRADWADDLETQANILALATAPALSFDDRESADRTLAALQARPTIDAAAIYLPDGALYAGYERKNSDDILPEVLPALPAGVSIDGPLVELVQAVVQNGEPLGTIYLRARYDVQGRVLAYLRILGGVMVMSLTIALLASGWLQRSISKPIGAMAEISRKIVERRDYSLRAETSGEGEIGLVVDAFNSMLDEVQARTHALEAANTALKEEVAVRVLAEQEVLASEKLYRAIGESIEYGVWICDPEGRCVYASDSFLELTGLTQEQCSSLGWADRLHPDDSAATMEAWLACVRAGTPWYREHRIRGADGQYHHVLAQGVPIRNDQGQIVRWAGINLDIRQLKTTEDALRDADRRKDEFLATLAHELRNPLAPIRNAVQILDSPRADEQQRRWCREVIARQVHHMALLLDDLLDVSRITRGQLNIKKSIVDLNAVIQAALETARPLIDAKQHLLRVDVPAHPVVLDADALRLSQVLGNLLTNAAKYMDPGGHITLGATLSDEGLVLSVRDTGIGLSPETIPGLFTIFSQVSSAISRADGGLGIGLALVRGLVTLHGGTVSATSAGLGKGSEFIVRLPRTIIHSLGHAPARIASPLESGAGTHGGATILVADDNRDAAESLAAALRQSGYKVITAFSGPEALEIGAQERPHAVFLDIGMPGMSGYDVARSMRTQAWGASAVIIALTGWGQEQDKHNARAAGFDEHLTKPVSPHDLEQVVDALLSSAAAVAAAQTRKRSENQ